MAQQQLHALAEHYLDAVYDLPDELRARKPLEDQLAAAMTGGHHVAIRGFWRIGKTTLLKGVLQRATERTGGAAFLFDARDPTRDDGSPASLEALLARLAHKVQEFLNRVGAAQLKADPARPLAILGELAAPLFVGVDELIAAHTLGEAGLRAVVGQLLETPKNVKVAVVCHRHRDLSPLLEPLVYRNAHVTTADVPPISDDELVNLVQTPALEHGVTFANEALGALADITGNRPWEVLLLSHLTTARLEPSFRGSISPEQVEAVLDLDVLAGSEEGGPMVENCLRVLVTAMSEEERSLLEMLATGRDGEATEDAVSSLTQAGWLIPGQGGYDINGALMEGIARAVAQGEIKVKVEASSP